MEKPTAAAQAAFDAAFPADERAVRKRMFGMPAGVVNGNLFLGVWGNGLVLRLGEDGGAELAGHPGVGPFSPKEGRPWKAYVLADVDACADHLAEWTRLAFEHTSGLPPKPQKGR